MNDIAHINQGSRAPTVPFEQQNKLAVAFAKSGLFGVKTPEQALALMALCEAEGLHPAIAIRDYHIIQGKPALKADAMLARFQSAGGRVEWNELSDERVSATFSHPSGGKATIDWDMERAKNAGFDGKDNWKKFPRAMLRSRVVSEGIRTVFPGVVVGTYTPEEVLDFDDKPSQQPPETYSDDRLESNIEQWRGMVQGGSITPENIIATVESLYRLTDDQKQRIHDLAVDDAEFTETEGDDDAHPES